MTVTFVLPVEFSGHEDEGDQDGGGAALVAQPPGGQPLHRMTPVACRVTPAPKKPVKNGSR